MSNIREPERIALYMHSVGTARGGAERMICQLAGAFAEKGLNVTLITCDSPDAATYYPLNPSVQWARLGVRPGWADKLRRVWRLYRLLKDQKIAALIGFVMSTNRTVYAAAKLAGIKLIVAERNAPSMYWLRYGWTQRLISFALLRLADRITVQLPSFKHGYPTGVRDRIFTIPNPVPAPARRAAPGTPDASGRFTLLCVSRLDATQKRVDCLVRTFSKIVGRFPAWDLHIVGDGPELGRLQSIVADSGLGGRVMLKPSVSNVFDLYADAHLFVIPSRWEGFSNALAEAMCHGLPPVGFAHAQGVADLIGGAGWLAAGYDDEEALAAALAQAMENDAERVLRGSRAAEAMRAFEPEVQYECWASLLRSTLRNVKP